ncbi:hypothetical protein [Microbacterium sp. Leaf320]|uniref:hypothetical protein n=1 Tax=Microbacterium sp. Leaf320 TaxID=1736334 RepID=UPI0006F8C851|nr:hypothetical protein [Microbacterium sp. Leaf320]KQQ65024.1 hypothetical protein ASF63_13710 [Microbacterium sp. Leaf320]
MDNPLFFIALIAAVIVLAIFLPRWVRRSSRTAGERAEQRVTASRLEELLGELGSTLVLHAPEPVAREIVDGVALQQPRKFTVLPDGGYGIRFVEPDDSLVRLVEDQGGTRVQIERFREYLGRPQTTEFWADLCSRIASAASARGVATTAGPTLRHRRDDASGTWSLE